MPMLEPERVYFNLEDDEDYTQTQELESGTSTQKNQEAYFKGMAHFQKDYGQWTTKGKMSLL